MLSITTFIENEFQKKLKTEAVFLDLICSYDTVWKCGLLLKLAKILKCKTSLLLIDNMLSDRIFKWEKSKYKYLQKDLPQGSVLSSILFNVYIALYHKYLITKVHIYGFCGARSTGWIFWIIGRNTKCRLTKSSRIFQNLIRYIQPE